MTNMTNGCVLLVNHYIIRTYTAVAVAIYITIIIIIRITCSANSIRVPYQSKVNLIVRLSLELNSKYAILIS